MPPKEAAPAAGPTIEEFEAEWKAKIAVWEKEEFLLNSAVASSISENAFLSQQVAIAKKDIDRLHQQRKEMTRRSDEQQLHLFHHAKSAAEAIERDQHIIAKQAADVEGITATIGRQKQDVKHAAAAVEQAKVVHEHHLALVRKRASLTAMLKERLVKLRQEHVQAEVKLRQALKRAASSSSHGSGHHPQHQQPLRSAVHSLALLVGSRTVLSDIVTARLQSAFGFDVAHIVLPAPPSSQSYAAEWQRGAAVCEPLVEPHPACFALGSGGPAASYINIGGGNGPSSGGGGDDQLDPATAFLEHFSTAIMKMSRGANREQRAIACIAGNIAPGSTDADTLLFDVRVPQHHCNIRTVAQDSGALTTSGSSNTSGTGLCGGGAFLQEQRHYATAVVAVKDILATLCGPLCTQRNILVLLELRDPADDSRLIVIFTPETITPLVLQAEPATGKVELGLSSGLVVGALASLLSGPCAWGQLPVDKLIPSIEQELLRHADTGRWTVRPAAGRLPVWCGAEWPRPGPVGLYASRPVSRVLATRPSSAATALAPPSGSLLPPAPKEYMLPKPATPALLSVDACFCLVSYFIPSAMCANAAAAASSLVGELGTVISVQIADGAATSLLPAGSAAASSSSTAPPQFADIFVSGAGAGLAAGGAQAALAQQHRLAHVGFDPFGPPIAVTSTLEQGDARLVRIQASNGGGGGIGGRQSLLAATRCTVPLVGSDRLRWERDHRPYDPIATALRGVSDTLPDTCSFSLVTACTAVVRCTSAAALIALLRQSAMIDTATLPAIHAGTAPIPFFPSVSQLASYVPLREVVVGGSMHKMALSKLGPHALQSQCILCLVVTDGEKSASVGAQHTAVHAASQYLTANVPVARSAVFLHVDLQGGLSCSRADLKTMAGLDSSSSDRPSSPEASSDAATDPAAAAQRQKLLDKRQTWRKLMQLLPASAVDFLLTVTYPCLVVSSPCIQDGERSMLVVPRTLQTLCPTTRTCLFSASTIVTATTFFAEELLWELASQREGSKGAASKSRESWLQNPQLSSWIML